MKSLEPFVFLNDGIKKVIVNITNKRLGATVVINEKEGLAKNVVSYEPHTALFVPENDPLVFYKAIADFATSHLAQNGLLFFEINESYGKQIVELLNDKGFTNIELRKDMSGRDRMVNAFFNSILVKPLSFNNLTICSP